MKKNLQSKQLFQSIKEIRKMSSIKFHENKIIEINQNQRSTDLIQPLTKPKQTQPNYGLMLQPNSDEKISYRPLQKCVINKMAKSRKEDRIPRPGDDINQVWNIYKQFTGSSNLSEKDWRNPIYARPYYYEDEFFEMARQNFGRNYLKDISIVCPASGVVVSEMDENLMLEEIKRNWADYYGDEKRMIEFPKLFPHFTEEERKAKMFESGRPFRSKIVQWYLKHQPTKQ